jgi:acetylglutamate kinase
MRRLVVKLGGRVAKASAPRVLALATRGDEVCVVHGAGPQISDEMARAGVPVEFVEGRRVTSEAALAIVLASFKAVNEELCAAIGPEAVGLSGDEIGLDVEPVPALGLVGEARPTPLPVLVETLAAGKIPVVAPVTRRLNVNADSAAAAIAAGIAADQLVFLTDVDGLILDGEIVDSIGLEAAEELMRSGTLVGGIIPKLAAAIAAARSGVPAWIGRTEVPVA